MTREINQDMQKKFEKCFTTISEHINKRMAEIEKRKEVIKKEMDKLSYEFNFINDEWLRLQTVLNSTGQDK